MSNFNDKALKGVAEAVSKIVDEELKGNQHKIDANKNGKIDAHDFKLLRAKKTIKEDDVGYQHRYSVKNGKATVHNPAKGEKDEPHHVYADSEEHAVRKHAAQTKPTVKEEVKKNEYHIAGKHKFPTKDEHAVTVKHTESGREHVHSGKGKYLSKLIKSRYDINHHFESVELDEAFPTVDDAKKRMTAGKTATGSVTKTKTGLVHKRDYKDDDNDAEDMQKKSKGYGARQNFKRSTRVNEQLSFTEMLHLYNEHGIEVISKIAPQTVKFGDIEVEVIDANIVNGAVGITVAEEVDNETFTKEVEAQKAKNAGGGKKAEVAKASVQAVKQEEVELDEAKKMEYDQKKVYHLQYVVGVLEDAKKQFTKLKDTAEVIAVIDKAINVVAKEYTKHLNALSAGRGQDDNFKVAEMISKLKFKKSKKTNEEVEQIDEISKETAGKYLTAPQGKGANKYKVSADLTSYPDIGTMNKHATNVRRALQRSDSSSIYKKPSYYKEETQLDEKLPASASAGDYIHDFVHSDNPKFAGKSTKERQKMALGAFYAKNKGK
jgi:hypothetical protein